MRFFSFALFLLLAGCSDRGSNQDVDAHIAPTADSGAEDAAVAAEDAGLAEDAAVAEDAGLAEDAGSGEDAAIASNDAGTDDAGSRLRNCDQRPIACRALPPECPAGQLPEVEGTCWSGACVPLNQCGCTEHAACGPEGMYACHRETHCGDWL